MSIQEWPLLKGGWIMSIESLQALKNGVDPKSKSLEERVISQFHIISEGLVDQIGLLAERHTGIIDRLTMVDELLNRLGGGNKRW